MFGRNLKQKRNRVIHTPECSAIHEAVLMSLYFGYGAASAPLFVPSGGLVCTCDRRCQPLDEVATEPVGHGGANRDSALVSA